MGFEVFKSTRNGVLVTPGNVRITRKGRARFSQVDLRRVGIVTHATILLDRKARRVGLRAPREGESPRLMKVSASEFKTSDVFIQGALQAIGVTLPDGVESFPVDVGDDVISIDFSEFRS